MLLGLRNVLAGVVLGVLSVCAVSAGPISLLSQGDAGPARAALIELDRPPVSLAALSSPSADLEDARAASLFAPGQNRGLFASRPSQIFGAPALLDLIARAEAGPAGYDAVQLGARIRPAAPPTDMTIAEIYRWIDDTPGQPHAIGRYQFIPPTLRRLVNMLGLPASTRFSPQVQDQLAQLLLEEAGMTDYVQGTMRQYVFMNNLAKIWAGLPTSSGRSHYDGYAGNKAVITWSTFRQEMDRIFPRG